MNKLVASVLIAATCALSASANAGIIYTPTIYNDSGFYEPNYSAVHAIDQSGLSIGYSSGSTDFDTYAALNPTHTGSSGTNGALDLNETAAFIDFDFGSELSFTDFGLFNDNDQQGIREFNILVSNASDFSTATTLGTFTATYGPSNYSNPIALQQFDMSGATGRYVRVDMLNTHGWININFGEFIFAANLSSVPEPAPLAMFGLALAAIGFSRKMKAPK